MGAANNVQLIGRITKDVEVRKSSHEGGQAAASFTIAVDRDVPKHRTDGQQSQTADFISCATFGSRAEALGNYTSKGSLIAVHGHIQTRSYKAGDGRTVYVTEVVCDSLRFLDTRKPRAAKEASVDSLAERPELSDNLSERDKTGRSGNPNEPAQASRSEHSGGGYRQYQSYESDHQRLSGSDGKDSAQSSGSDHERENERHSSFERGGAAEQGRGFRDPYPEYPQNFASDDVPF